MDATDRAAPTARPDERLLVCALVAAERLEPAQRAPAAETLAAALAALSDRVMWLAPLDGAGPLGALLDLGRCPLDEARAICAQLSGDLARGGLSARAGAGPTQTLARLAALLAAPGSARALSRDWLASTARDLAVDLFARLEPETITPEITGRLRRYGLTTWAHVRRVEARDPQGLRRQFGAPGALLATLARGDDPRPFTPSTPPERVRVRRRFIPEASADQALAALPGLASGLARRLAALADGKQGRDLRLRVVWESGAITRARRRLARPLAQPDELAQAAGSLLMRLLTPEEPEARTPVAIASLTLALGDLSPRPSARQEPLFAGPAEARARHERARRLARIAAEVGEPLARRYGAPALYQLEVAHSDAILPEERARLVQLGEGRGGNAGWRAPHTGRGGDATERGADEANGGVTPPQPHWW